MYLGYGIDLDVIRNSVIGATMDGASVNMGEHSQNTIDQPCHTGYCHSLCEPFLGACSFLCYERAPSLGRLHRHVGGGLQVLLLFTKKIQASSSSC